MRVLFVASEMHPLVKTGGLADVTGALPLALAPLGIEVRTLLPAYPRVLERLQDKKPDATIKALFGGTARLVSGRTAAGAHVLALDAPHLYAREGSAYGPTTGQEWPDNHLRFGALGWAAHLIGLGQAGPWRPEVVHAHDWQAALAPAYLALSGRPRPATVTTIHNMAFQGLFPGPMLASLRLPESSFAPAGVEFYGKVGFLKAGLHYADRITTVSPSYAREIQSSAHGFGLEGLLRHRAKDLTGILNGIDRREWDPEHDPHIAAPFSAASPAGKVANKRALQERFGLKVDDRALLFCVVSRLTHQKGLDILMSVLPALVARGGQIAVLGLGDTRLEGEFAAAARANPAQIAFKAAFDERLSHVVQAGADAIVVPSRFEPCGLTQMVGLRYGTVPVVARVGGLADSVIDANEAALNDDVATGFQFAPDSGIEIADAIARASTLFAQPDAWTRTRHRGMRADFGWERSAKKYAAMYRELATK